MKLEQKIEVPELKNVIIDELLKILEDEAFDRTLGGQDSLGKKVAGFGTKNGGILLVGQQDLKEGGKIVGINEDEFHKEFGNAIPPKHFGFSISRKSLGLNGGKNLSTFS